MQINNNSQYSYEEILKEDFDLTKLQNISQLIIVYDKYNEYYERTHTVSDIAKKMESQNTVIYSCRLITHRLSAIVYTGL